MCYERSFKPALKQSSGIVSFAKEGSDVSYLTFENVKMELIWVINKVSQNEDSKITIFLLHG